jgi:hypothetical protein
MAEATAFADVTRIAPSPSQPRRRLAHSPRPSRPRPFVHSDRSAVLARDVINCRATHRDSRRTAVGRHAAHIVVREHDLRLRMICGQRIENAGAQRSGRDRDRICDPEGHARHRHGAIPFRSTASSTHAMPRDRLYARDEIARLRQRSLAPDEILERRPGTRPKVRLRHSRPNAPDDVGMARALADQRRDRPKIDVRRNRMRADQRSALGLELR